MAVKKAEEKHQETFLLIQHPLFPNQIFLVKLYALPHGPESIYNMETCNVLLTLKSVEEILWCHHSNETSLSALFFFQYFIKFKLLSKF